MFHLVLLVLYRTQFDYLFICLFIYLFVTSRFCFLESLDNSAVSYQYGLMNFEVFCSKFILQKMYIHLSSSYNFEFFVLRTFVLSLTPDINIYLDI